MRGSLEAGDLPRQTAHETEVQRQERMRAVYDYLQDRYLAGYDDYVRAVQARNAHGIPEEPMAPWQWRSLPSHARARWLGSQHVDQFDTDEYGRLQAGPEWVHRTDHRYTLHHPLYEFPRVPTRMSPRPATAIHLHRLLFLSTS